METKRYKSSLFSLIAFVGFISCGQPSVVYEPPLFPERRQAAVEVLNDTYLFRYANQPAFYDSLLIVADMSEEAGICLFNRYDGRLVKAFGRKGNGPGEFYRADAPRKGAARKGGNVDVAGDFGSDRGFGGAELYLRQRSGRSRPGRAG